jgi:sulfur carrier protein
MITRHCGVFYQSTITALELIVNGERKSFDDCPREVLLDMWLQGCGLRLNLIAVALNEMILPRSKWAQTVLLDGDRIEIVHFVGGGI